MPLTFNEDDHRAYADLAGLSTDVIAACNGQRFREKMLITHRGLSGPAILQISSYWKKGQPILVDLAPEGEITASLRRPACPRTLAALRAALQIFLPNRFPLPITIRSYSLASMVCLEQNLVAVKLSLFSREQKWITGAVTMY